MCKNPSQKDENIFDSSLNFSDLGLKSDLLRSIEECGFKHPTFVQAALIPKALEGNDILGQSRTGSGKTAAFGIPLLQRVSKEEPLSALVLVPTRELALQVTEELRSLGKYLTHNTLPIYGGQPIRIQEEKLNKKPSIIVGTPGRIIDMNLRKLLPFQNLKTIVLDEVDRMLDIGFREDIKKILNLIPNRKQTIFVSATISEEIKKLAYKFMNKPLELNLSSAGSLTVQQVDQSHYIVPYWAKSRLLIHLLKQTKPSLALIFCRTKMTVEKVNDALQKIGLNSTAIHGDLRQNRRNTIMNQLREGKLKLVVASDLAARGIDVEGITHVINYDLPEDPEIYVHRIGRTARAGRDGTAWSFVATDEGALLDNIERLTNTQIPEKTSKNFELGPEPERIRKKREQQEASTEKERAESRHSLRAPLEEASKNNQLFPGGIVPSSAPKKRLGGRSRTRRK